MACPMSTAPVSQANFSKQSSELRAAFSIIMAICVASANQQYGSQSICALAELTQEDAFIPKIRCTMLYADAYD